MKANMKAKYFFDVFHFYRQQMKLRDGNVLTPVCHSVHRAACVAEEHMWQGHKCLGHAWQGA